jgi:very-short-patch-repair endonuclease
MTSKTAQPLAQRDISSRAARQAIRRRRAEKLAEQQDGIVSRQEVYALGLTRGEVRAQVRAARWRRVGRSSICVHRGPLSIAARHRIAVIEAGPRGFLDGGSALLAVGLRSFSMEQVRVSVPRGARIWRAKGVNIRQTRRWDPSDLGSGEPRRARVEVAAIRHALWARSDREAALVLTMVVQQGLTSAEMLGSEMLRVRRDKRRAFIHAVILDLLGGVQSLAELDVAGECRRRGLPEPTRQVCRRSPHGTYFLDLLWERWGLVVEVDGIHHSWAQNLVDDAIRHNDIALSRDVVLRLPLLGLRVAPDAFFGQIAQALRDAGCPLPGLRSA